MVEGVGGGEAGGQGLGELQARAKSRGWATFAGPTQKSGAMTPEPASPPAGQGRVAAVGGRGSHVGEGVALAKGLVLLGVESLSFQVDLTYLGTAKVQLHGVGGGKRGPFPTS